MEPPNCKKYGVPFYGASWVPPTANPVKSEIKASKDDESDGGDGGGGGGEGSPPSVEAEKYVVLSGGGGEGHSGIPNALILSHFDAPSNSLSDQPVARLETSDNLPYRMVVHPGGEGIICSFSNSCKWFDWDTIENNDVHKLTLRSSERILSQLQNVGQQLALTFNNEGSVLAVGGEDGRLRVFKWPSMEIILDEANAHNSVKDLDFSPDGKFLVSVGGRGSPGRVWDVASSSAIASLSKEHGEDFGFCRFSHAHENNQVLYVTVMRDKGGSIAKYNTTSWKRMSLKQIVRDPFSAFSASADGNLLAIGTIQGDILVLNSTSMRVRTMVRKAHLGFLTALAFSHDSRALVSVSMDSSARVTLITDEKKNGMGMWIIILLIILIAVTVYYAKTQGILLKLLPCCH
ncbi:hypothetical protein LguiA_032488 [Lonicera macranthoides]